MIISPKTGRVVLVDFKTTSAQDYAHFLEVLVQLHHQHHATKAAEAPTLASTADLTPTAANAEANGPAQPPINPFTRPRPDYRDLDNRREEPPF